LHHRMHRLEDYLAENFGSPRVAISALGRFTAGC
jgi:hypothetical protein